MKRLSIVIVTYNSENHIYDCLDSVWHYTDIPKEQLEVIVVDNNSPQADAMSGKIRSAYGEAVTLIRNTRNGGYGQGNNLGIRQATAPVVLIVNPDVRFVEPVFATALQAFDDDPRLSMYGVKQMLTPQQASTNSFSCTYTLNGYAYTLLTSLANRFDIFIPRYMFLQGSCFFVRKEMFDAIGLFDESNFMYGEEDDIHYRIMQRFGPHMRYNRHLHYIHLTKDRQPDADYEKRVLASVVALFQKKGIPARRILNNRLQATRLLLLRERLRLFIGKKDKHLYDMLTSFKSFLKEQIENSKTP